MPTIPTAPPATATAGDSVVWDQAAGDYAPSDGWALVVAFAGSEAEAAAAVVDGTFRVTLSTTLTASLGPGAWQWVARVTRGSERVTIATGTLTLAADPRQASATTHAARALAAIEAVIENRASADVLKYEIAGRSLEKMAPADLLMWRNYYRAEVNAERGTRGASIGVLRYQIA